MRGLSRSPLTLRSAAACVGLFLMPLEFGCSAIVVASAPLADDLTVLEEGTPRDEVLQELGRPVETVKTTRCHDDVLFEPGYSLGQKTLLIPLILTLDFFSFGTAEAQLFPAMEERERMRAGVLVHYDEDERVVGACVYQGQHWIHRRPGAPPSCNRSLLELQECIELEDGAREEEVEAPSEE